MSKIKTISSFGAMLRHALCDAVATKAGSDFLAMCADDIIFQFPYAPTGTVRELKGKTALSNYISKVGDLIAFESLSIPTVHQSKDGQTFILEFTCKASGIDTSERYDQNYISVIEIQNSQIIRYQDYWNPLILLNAVGGKEALTSHFQEFIHA